MKEMAKISKKTHLLKIRSRAPLRRRRPQCARVRNSTKVQLLRWKPTANVGGKRDHGSARRRVHRRVARSRGRRRMIHQALEELNKSIVIRPKYDNFIGGAVGAAGARPVLQQSDAGDRPAAVRGRALDRRGHREGARRRPRRQGCLGQDLARRALAHPQQDRRSHGRAAARPGDGRDARQRQADPRDAAPPTCRWRSTTSATSPAASAPRKARSARSTTPPMRTISTSRSVSSARSSRGTSRC